MKLIYSTFIILTVVTISISIIIIIRHHNYHQHHHQHNRHHHQQHQGWYFGHGGAISYVDKFLRTKFDALLAKKDQSTLTFYFLLHILLQAGLGIVQCCNIVPSLVSSFGESWDSGIYFAPQLPRGFDHFYGAGQGGEPPLPTARGGAGNPPFPAGQGVHPWCALPPWTSTSDGLVMHG